MTQSCKIVMYHYVRPVKQSVYPEIKGLELESFIRQIEYFRNNFNFITSDQLLGAIYGNECIPENSILLTFDDAYKDHYLYVFPILKRLNIQGMFFPPGEAIAENYVLDVNKIHFILATCKDKQKIIDEIFSLINQHRKNYDLDTPESYFLRFAVQSRFDTKEVIFIKKVLQRELPPILRSKFTNYLFRKFVTDDERSFSEELYLSYDEINEMQENGMYFGSHGYSHEWLANLSEEELNVQLDKGLKFYSKINKNKHNWIMCYPYGSYNDFIIQKLKDQGFKAGLTADVGDATLTKENAFYLKRYDTNDFPK